MKIRWIGRGVVERLWRLLKYDCVYLLAFETGSHAGEGIGRLLDNFNAERPCPIHGVLPPDEVHARKTVPMSTAARRETLIHPNWAASWLRKQEDHLS